MAYHWNTVAPYTPGAYPRGLIEETDMGKRALEWAKGVKLSEQEQDRIAKLAAQSDKTDVRYVIEAVDEKIAWEMKLLEVQKEMTGGRAIEPRWRRESG